MVRTVEDLDRKIAEAVAAENYEQAAALRDERIALTGQADPGSKLRPQIPGKMGLGTSDQTFRPPADWTPPKRPDMMTSNTKPRRGRR